MTGNRASADDAPHRLSRAWLTAMLLASLTLAALVLTGPAQALTLPPVGPLPGAVLLPAAHEDEEEAEASDGEEEGEGEECEVEGFDEEDEGEEAECAEDAGGEASGAAPAACLLRTVDVKAVVFEGQDKVGVTIRYTAIPTDAVVGFHLHGGRGSLSLGPKDLHLGRRGVLHYGESLSAHEAEKARAAASVTVTLRIPDTPGYCHAASTLHLSSRHPGHGQVAFTQPGSSLRR